MPSCNYFITIFLILRLHCLRISVSFIYSFMKHFFIHVYSNVFFRIKSSLIIILLILFKLSDPWTLSQSSERLATWYLGNDSYFEISIGILHLCAILLKKISLNLHTSNVTRWCYFSRMGCILTPSVPAIFNLLHVKINDYFWTFTAVSVTANQLAPLFCLCSKRVKYEEN